MPASRRDAVVGPTLRSLREDWALAVLDRYPLPGLAKALLDAYYRDVAEHGSGPATWQKWLAAIEALGKKHPA